MEELQQDNESQNPLLPVTGWGVDSAPFVDCCATQSLDLIGYPDHIPSIGGFSLGFLVCGSDDLVGRLTWGGKPVIWYKEKEYSGIASEPHGNLPLYLKEEIQALRDRVPSIVSIISVGGASGVPLEVCETSVPKIVNEYKTMLQNYGFTHLDMNFEDSIIHIPDALGRNIEAVKQLLAWKQDLRISYTLQVDTNGFNSDGKEFLKNLAGHEIVPDVIQPMLMYMGPTPVGKSEYDQCVSALDAVIKDVKNAWTKWTTQQIWDKLGLCPMFGKQIEQEIFTIDDMTKLLGLAQRQNVAMMSGWNVNHDSQGTPVTGTPQKPFQFSQIAAQYHRRD
jgi:chitinase